MKKIIYCAIIISFLFALKATATEMRTWSTETGNFTTEAEFVKLSNDGKMVTIKRKDDEIRDVSLDRLSKEDQEYVAKVALPTERWASSLFREYTMRIRKITEQTDLSESTLKQEVENNKKGSQIVSLIKIKNSLRV